MSETTIDLTTLMGNLEASLEQGITEKRVVVQVAYHEREDAIETIREAGYEISNVNDHDEGTSIYFNTPRDN